MNSQLTRRDMLKGSVAFAALAFAQYPLSTFGFPEPEEGAELIPFLDKQAGKNGITWEKLESWVTPNAELYQVQHYGVPKFDLAPGSWNSAASSASRARSRWMKSNNAAARPSLPRWNVPATATAPASWAPSGTSSGPAHRLRRC